MMYAKHTVEKTRDDYIVLDGVSYHWHCKECLLSFSDYEVQFKGSVLIHQVPKWADWSQ